MEKPPNCGVCGRRCPLNHNGEYYEYCSKACFHQSHHQRNYNGNDNYHNNSNQQHHQQKSKQHQQNHQHQQQQQHHHQGYHHHHQSHNSNTNLNSNLNIIAQHGKSVGMMLSVLQRLDPNISRIEDTAAHVVVYTFDESKQSWEKKNIEGPFYVFQRTIAPHYGFFVMNRLSPDNFCEFITPDLEVQITTQFILYKNPQGQVYGLWFYLEEEREKFGNLIRDYTKKVFDDRQADLSSKLAPLNISQSQPSQDRTSQSSSQLSQSPQKQKPIDIMAILEQASKKYEGQQQPSGPTTPTKAISVDVLEQKFESKQKDINPTIFQNEIQDYFKRPEPDQVDRILLSPMDLKNKSKVAKKSLLTRDAFKDKLISLLQTDPQFLDTLYKQYEKNF